MINVRLRLIVSMELVSLSMRFIRGKKIIVLNTVNFYDSHAFNSTTH